MRSRHFFAITLTVLFYSLVLSLIQPCIRAGFLRRSGCFLVCAPVSGAQLVYSGTFWVASSHISGYTLYGTSLGPAILRLWGARSFNLRRQDGTSRPRRTHFLRKWVCFTLRASNRHMVERTNQYDIIISEPSNPQVSGVGDLFSTEFFTLCAQLLKPGGVMAQWLHGYSMDMVNFKLSVRTFAACFEQVTIWEAMEDDFVMIGCSGDFSPDFSMMTERIDQGPVGADLALINIGDLAAILARQFVSPDYVYRVVGDGEVNRELMPVLEYNAPLVLFKRKKVSIKQIDERFSTEETGLYINAYRDLFPLTARNYHNMAAYEFKNPFDSDLQIAYSLMVTCVAAEPENQQYLYDFAILLQRIGKLAYAREIAARLLQIDKENSDYQGIFLDITYAIEQEKGSIFYPPGSAE